MLKVSLYFPVDFSKYYGYQYSHLLLTQTKSIIAPEEILALATDIDFSTIGDLVYTLTSGTEVTKLEILHVSFTIM